MKFLCNTLDPNQMLDSMEAQEKKFLLKQIKPSKFDGKDKNVEVETKIWIDFMRTISLLPGFLQLI